MPKQLQTLLEIEQNKEQTLARALQQAEQECQQHQLRLQSVADYRLEYMKKLMARCQQGIDSATYRHFNAFVAKLDNAAEQLERAIAQAKSLVVQKKQLWLKQHQRVQAVENLLNKRQLQQQVSLLKKEQQAFDEMALQGFIRQSIKSE